MKYLIDKNKRLTRQSGQLLLEILIAVVAVVAIAALGAQLILVGGSSNKFAGERTVALGVAEETIESIRSAVTEEWQWVYRPPDGNGDPVTSKGSSNLYHPLISTDKWILATGSEVVVINGVSYTYSFYIENVNRDSSRNIVLTGGSDDPSTQKITVTVTWGDDNSVETSEYFTRWHSIGCAQTDWSGGSGGEMSTCPATTYDSATNLGTETDLSIQ